MYIFAVCFIITCIPFGQWLSMWTTYLRTSLIYYIIFNYCLLQYFDLNEGQLLSVGSNLFVIDIYISARKINIFCIKCYTCTTMFYLSVGNIFSFYIKCYTCTDMFYFSAKNRTFINYISSVTHVHLCLFAFLTANAFKIVFKRQSTLKRVQE